MSSLAPQDATMYWLSRRIRNDQFLLYCFAESECGTPELRRAIVDRCAAIPELRVRLREDPTGLSYPRWVPCVPASDQFVDHASQGWGWSRLLRALGELLHTGVDPVYRPWRLHVFRGIREAPTGDPFSTVVVLQTSHALADGRGAARLARGLFTGSGETERSGTDRNIAVPRIGGRAPGAETAVPDRERGVARWPGRAVRAVASRFPAGYAAARMPTDIVRTLGRGVRAHRAQRELARLTSEGRLPGPAPGYPPGPLNGPEQVTGHTVRVIVRPVEDFRVSGHSITVVALTAVSLAVERYLASRGESVRRLGAQVPMALPEVAGVRNNYRSLGVDLCAGESDLRRRAAAIAEVLAARRSRAVHPLLAVQDAVTAAVPALVHRRDVQRFPIETIPGTVAGHTVLSSVDRGPADLTFGGAPVRFTAGFPALGSVMHLTHGLHGLGGTVTFSVHADPAAVPDIDVYTERLRSALGEVVAAHRMSPGSPGP
ncbi:WS/DGAT domain-containing protein [Nocardia brevicatena]|uniref:WS/DGAT domain-containing protein n=1 Tax=Nocardia brevicatena TaxID=37327 RepID=UPI0005928ACC|nr:WS/DGAT domain-containing protein [Nocardia brevicatena]